MVFELFLCGLDGYIYIKSMLVINLIACHTMWILMHAFFEDTFQPMNAALTFQIGLNDCARAIRGKFVGCLGKFSENPDGGYVPPSSKEAKKYMYLNT